MSVVALESFALQITTTAREAMRAVRILYPKVCLVPATYKFLLGGPTIVCALGWPATDNCGAWVGEAMILTCPVPPYLKAVSQYK